jgi:magnesium transporter
MSTATLETVPADEEVVEVAGSADDTDAERIIGAWIFTDGGVTARKFASIEELDWNPKKGVLWLDLCQYENEDLSAFARQLELDKAGVAAALAPWQRPAVDAFANHAFVNASVLRVDLDALWVSANEIDCFIGERFVLLAHNQPLPFFDNVLARAETTATIIAEDPAYLLYILLDELIDDFAAQAEALDEMIEELENEALTASAGNDFLNELVKHKRFVYAVHRVVSQHGFIFHGLLRPDFPFVSGKSMEGYFAELNERFCSVAASFADARQEIVGAFEIYMSSVAHRTNGIVKILTMISILVLPATAIFGFFGTNFVQLPFFGTVGFIVMFALLVILTVTQIMIFRRKGWMS